MRSSLALMACAAVFNLACGAAKVMCGAGTHLEDNTCVLTLDAGVPDDAGTGAELPTTAIVSPVRVMEGFAACPSITLAWADGRTNELVLDPTDRLNRLNALPFAQAGLTLTWASSDGLVRTGALTHCLGAIVGLRPGTASVALEVTNAVGATRTVGHMMVEVLPLQSTGINLDRFVFAAHDLGRVACRAPTGIVRETNVLPLPLGESSEVELLGTINVADSTDVQFLVVPENLQLTSSLPGVVALEPSALHGAAVGLTTVTARYVVGTQTLGTAQADVWVSDAQQTIDLALTTPVDDRGFLLPDAQRYAQTLTVGQCISFDAWATVAATAPSASTLTSFQRKAPDATWKALGTGLTQSTEHPQHFCATAPGEAAVQVCRNALCRSFGLVVEAPQAPTPTLTGSLPTEMVVAMQTIGFHTVCADLQLTAQYGTDAPHDVSSSVALRFANPFTVMMASPMFPHLDDTTGLQQRSNGKPCFDVQVDAPARLSTLRFFWGNAQIELTSTPRF